MQYTSRDLRIFAPSCAWNCFVSIYSRTLVHWAIPIDYLIVSDWYMIENIRHATQKKNICSAHEPIKIAWINSISITKMPNIWPLVRPIVECWCWRQWCVFALVRRNSCRLIIHTYSRKRNAKTNVARFVWNVYNKLCVTNELTRPFGNIILVNGRRARHRQNLRCATFFSFVGSHFYFAVLLFGFTLARHPERSLIKHQPFYTHLHKHTDTHSHTERGGRG